MDNQQLLKEGTILNKGKYQIIRHIASGGFGNTYEVRNISLQSLRLAMKEFFIKGDTHRDSDSLTVTVSNSEKKELFSRSLAKFKTEAERLCQLRNEHIVGVHDFFEENGTAYYVMEYIEGKSLSQIQKESGSPMPEPQALSVLNQMLDALESVHSRQIWHMDIKPGNILIDQYGKCTLIDFGASKQTDVEGMVTASTSLAYTPGYAPPEQVGGNKEKWGPWTDLFALGATMYNLLTGNRPPNHDDVIDRGKDAYTYPANVSATTRRAIEKMMELSPLRRPQNVNEVRQLLNGQPITPPVSPPPFQGNDTTIIAPPFGTTNQVPPVGKTYPSGPAPSNPPQKSHKGIVIGLCAALFLLLAGIAVVLIRNNQNQQEAELKLAEMIAQNEKAAKELEAEKARKEEEERQRIKEEENRKEAARLRAEAAAAAKAAAVSGNWYFSGTLLNENGGYDDISFDLYASSNGSCSGTFYNSTYNNGYSSSVSGTVTQNSFNVRGGGFRFRGQRSYGDSYSGTATNGTVSYPLSLTCSHSSN
jgi:serine/threonine-protein kinase